MSLSILNVLVDEVSLIPLFLMIIIISISIDHESIYTRIAKA